MQSFVPGTDFAGAADCPGAAPARRDRVGPRSVRLCDELLRARAELAGREVEVVIGADSYGGDRVYVFPVRDDGTIDGWLGF